MLVARVIRIMECWLDGNRRLIVGVFPPNVPLDRVCTIVSCGERTGHPLFDISREFRR